MVIKSHKLFIEDLVDRAPMAAAPSGGVTGRVPLKIKMGAQVGNKVRIIERGWMRRNYCSIINIPSNRSAMFLCILVSSIKYVH